MDFYHLHQKSYPFAFDILALAYIFVSSPVFLINWKGISKNLLVQHVFVIFSLAWYIYSISGAVVTLRWSLFKYRKSNRRCWCSTVFVCKHILMYVLSRIPVPPYDWFDRKAGYFKGISSDLRTQNKIQHTPK